MKIKNGSLSLAFDSISYSSLIDTRSRSPSTSTCADSNLTHDDAISPTLGHGREELEEVEYMDRRRKASLWVSGIT